MLKITEDRLNDISTVYAYFVVPQKYPNGSAKMCDHWSCFNDDYRRGAEREFITKIAAENPEKYSSYHISWCDCN